MVLNREHKHTDRFVDVVSVKDFGAVGGDARLDVAGFQAAVDTGALSIFVPSADSTYAVNLKDLTYATDQLVRWDFGGSARTTDVMSPQCWVHVGGVGDNPDSVEFRPDPSDQMDVYRAVGTNYGSSDGTGKLFGFNFQLFAGEDTDDEEPVRGVIGRVTNLGTGSVKAIRAGATDSSTGGATALMALNLDVNAQANTNSSHIMFCQNTSASGVDDVTVACTFGSVNGARWKNGIVFTQGNEYSDAVFQASMGSGSASAARFLKLKDASANQSFYVDKDGLVFTSASLHAGVNETNSVKISTSSIERTAAAGDLTIKTGTNSGRVLVLDSGGSTNQFVMSDAGIRLGGPTGGHKGVGTINCKGVWEDGTQFANPDFVLEFAATGEFDHAKYEKDNAKRFIDSLIDELDQGDHSDFWKEHFRLPGMPSKEEDWSMGHLARGLWEELEKAHVFIDQLAGRVAELEAKVDGFK